MPLVNSLAIEVSSKIKLSNPTLNVLISWKFWYFNQAQIEEESKPPLNKTPTGTLLNIWFLTEELKLLKNHSFGFGIW